MDIARKEVKEPWFLPVLLPTFGTVAKSRSRPETRNIPVRARKREKAPLNRETLVSGDAKQPYCAFSRTGSTIYRKLSLPSTGVMTQGEILVFSSSRTLSAGA